MKKLKKLNLEKVVSKKKTFEEKTVEVWMKESAVREGEKYFDQVIYTLKSQIEDVKRNKKNWKLALKGKAHPNGHVPEKKLIVEQIEWNIDAMQQINLYHSLGARAMAVLTTAFKIEL